MKLQWESDGTSYSATGGSGRRYEIVLLYDATERGAKRAPRGWCLKADGEGVHFHTLRQCKKAGPPSEVRANPGRVGFRVAAVMALRTRQSLCSGFRSWAARSMP